ncbi:pullulanase [Bacillus ectoiniformans]|uniref:type I pullulanase n=1 Tax=Bacillus ectoiniformans TaxID=1494429 RepID=UPI00195A1549|nr:type I pullulanase [Bacillus ectoiniformans]MBM7649674.1 pullulanase [Bacillus ectoiniformans]
MIHTRPFHAYLDGLHLITIILPVDDYKGQEQHFFLEAPDELILLEVIETIHMDQYVKYSCRTSMMPEFGVQHIVTDERGMRTDLQMGAVIRSQEFDDLFYYNGKDLGSFYTSASTAFHLWAPTATEVFVKIKKTESSKVDYYQMQRTDKGVYRLKADGDFDGAFYQYKLRVNKTWQEAVDPYAQSVSLHSEWARVVDQNKCKVPRHDLPPLSSPLDAIIYEASIRDFSIHPDSGMKQKGTYLALTEKEAAGRYHQKTGIAYLKELGITHLELLPFNDFFGVSDNLPRASYNWGYNPLYFNVPEGSYSTDPSDAYCRIVELKTMVEELHKEGIRVIMDVVYNHVYIRETSAFERIVPGYFFRHDHHGRPSNGTGVGNDFASERRMARKFILDSLEYWLTAYNVDGFRFDLMGILDVRTMNEAKALVRAIKSDTILLGEGWDLNTPLPKEDKANIHNQGKLAGIAQFNDWFRDAIKGSTFNLYDLGYALGRETLCQDAFQVAAGSVGLKGHAGLFNEPDQTINYVESHDNYTMWDKLEACFPGESEKNKKRQRLATSMVLMAQGIPFLHSGQEFFRTKHGVENSYASSDEINQLDWNRLEDNRENVEYIKGMIAIRKSHQAFRLRDADSIRRHLVKCSGDHGPLIMLFGNVQSYGEWLEILLVFHPFDEKARIALPKRSSAWKIIADSTQAGTTVLGEAEDFLDAEPISCYICVR